MIIPVFNIEDYVSRCIESIINQTYCNLEIILINDGSTDNSGSICDEWAKRDSRIRVVTKENGGLSDARNEGIKAATGDFITFVDGDDIISSYMLDYLYKVLIENETDIAMTSMVKFDVKLPNYTNSSLVETMSSSEMLINKIYKNSTWEACGKLYRKSLFANGCEFLKGMLYEDMDFTLKIFSVANKVSFSHSNLYGYYQRDNSIMGKSKIRISEDLIEISKSNIDFINQIYMEQDYELHQELFSYFVKHPTKLLESIEESKSYKANTLFIRQYKSFYRSIFGDILKNKYIDKKYKVGIFISMFSVNIYNKLFKTIRFMNNMNLINWSR